jgi:glycosyltransferase involved in cell wall biosynthesis
MRLGRTPARREVALIVTPRFLPLLGGMERECALLADELARRGWDPLVVTEQLGFEFPRTDRVGSARVVRLPSAETRSLAVQLKVAWGIARILVAHRGRAGFAIVRTTTLPSLVVGLLKRLRLIRYPTFVTAETGGEGDDVAALAARPLFRVSRALVSGNDRLNGICGANVDHLREFGFPEAKITTIPNGIDVSAWHSSAGPARVERFLFLGRIEPAKGLFELLDAFEYLHRTHPAIRLTVAGDGPSRDDLVRLTAERGLAGAVDFPGRVDYERIGALFAEIDCLVLPSYSEGLPLSVLEAAAHRRAIVATDVGDIAALFGDAVYLCRPRDTADLTRALGEAIADPRPRADYEHVIAQVSIAAVTDRILASLQR